MRNHPEIEIPRENDDEPLRKPIGFWGRTSIAGHGGEFKQFEQFNQRSYRGFAGREPIEPCSLTQRVGHVWICIVFVFIIVYVYMYVHDIYIYTSVNPRKTSRGLVDLKTV